MGLFKSDEEKERKRKREEMLRGVVLFPGTIKEYELFRGYEVEIINTLRKDKGVTFINEKMKDKELACHLAQEGIEAIVNATVSYTTAGGGGIGSKDQYGLPVRRRKER